MFVRNEPVIRVCNLYDFLKLLLALYMAGFVGPHQFWWQVFRNICFSIDLKYIKT